MSDLSNAIMQAADSFRKLSESFQDLNSQHREACRNKAQELTSLGVMTPDDKEKHFYLVDLVSKL